MPIDSADWIPADRKRPGTRFDCIYAACNVTFIMLSNRIFMQASYIFATHQDAPIVANTGARISTEAGNVEGDGCGYSVSWLKEAKPHSHQPVSKRAAALI